MGRYRNHRSRTTKIKKYSKAVRTRCRPMDMDQVQDNLQKHAELAEAVGGEENIPKADLDEDLPGLGQFHCMTCAKYFIDQHHLIPTLRVKLTKRGSSSRKINSFPKLKLILVLVKLKKFFLQHIRI